MSKVFNVIVEVNMDFITKVNGMNMGDAAQKAFTDINEYNLYFNQNINALSHDGIIEFKYCDHSDVQIEEFVEEGEEFISCGSMKLTLMKDILANTYEQASLLSQIHFSDFNLSFSTIEVKNSLEENMEFSVGNWEIEVSDIEEVYEEDSYSTKIEKIFGNFQKTLEITNAK
jgi:hypothetical protein